LRTPLILLAFIDSRGVLDYINLLGIGWLVGWLVTALFRRILMSTYKKLKNRLKFEKLSLIPKENDVCQ